MYRKYTILIRLSLFALAGTLAWQSWGAFKAWSDNRSRSAGFRTVYVDVTGNVDKPGRYRVPATMSNYEILKVAGMRITSGIAGLDLAGQVQGNQTLNVDTLEKAVYIKPEVRLELIAGNLSVLSSDGQDRIVQEGMTLDEADRILTDERSQAELTFGDLSHISVDNFSEMSAEKIGVEENGQMVSRISQKTGNCWYQMRFTDKTTSFHTLTPKVKIAISGRAAEYSVNIKYAETIINNIDGLLLIERTEGNEAINLISGQSVTIYNDGRPFLVSKLVGDGGNADRFRMLSKAKADLTTKHMPLNLLFCSPPQAFVFISIQFDKNIVDVINIPPQTSARLFAQGFTTLQEAYLYGGTVFTNSIVERIISTRIPKYVVFDKNDILRTVTTLGTVKVAMDDKSASALNIHSGEQGLRPEAILKYLSPSISGVEDSRQRQMQLLKGIFNQIRTKNIIVTAAISDQLINNVETNFQATEIMGHYTNFMSRQNWRFRNRNLPVTEIKENNVTVYEPDMTACRKLLAEE